MNKTRKTKPSKRVVKKCAPRNKLEKATTAFYASLRGKDLEEENRLGAALAHAAALVNFDQND